MTSANRFGIDDGKLPYLSVACAICFTGALMSAGRPPLSERDTKCLADACVPTIALDEACASCPDNDDAAEYPRMFDVDLDSVMLGTCKGYGRQILISTGKHDWTREVTDDKASLAGLVSDVYNAASADQASAPSDSELSQKGLHTSIARPTDSSPPSSRLIITNSSFLSSADADSAQSIIVLPDYKIVKEVPESKEGASALVNEYLLPGVPLTGSASPRYKSWPLPYEAVILLCSHKKRDQRCHIAAPLLYEELHHHLQQHDIEIDNRGDGLTEGEAIEDWPAAEREQRLEAKLKGVRDAQSHRTVGVFSISHIGGHRYAGNLIIQFPNGTSVWYGRVRPRDIAAIVEHTVLGGKIIPEFLRGGLGLNNRKDSLLSW